MIYTIKRKVVMEMRREIRKGITWYKMILLFCVASILLLLRAIFALEKTVRIPNERLVKFEPDIPLIWIGGVPRSGTTLMRTMLDAHESVRCGEETHVIPRILGLHSSIFNSNVSYARYKEAGVNRHVLLNATASYLLNIISMHGEPAPRLCNKDPFTINSIDIVIEMFPKSKFIFMIRDGRATAHSIISRKVSIQGFDIKTYEGCLSDWNKAITRMHEKCVKAGEAHCLPVHYEQLVLHPRSQMNRILDFLDLPWSNNVLHHEDFINKAGGVSLSNREPSTGQVKRPVNLEGLTAWVDFIPHDVREHMAHIAPMLQVLGYDPEGYPPHYGEPDPEVVDNTRRVEQERRENGLTLAEQRKASMEQQLRRYGDGNSNHSRGAHVVRRVINDTHPGSDTESEYTDHSDTAVEALRRRGMSMQQLNAAKLEKQNAY